MTLAGLDTQRIARQEGASEGNGLVARHLSGSQCATEEEFLASAREDARLGLTVRRDLSQITFIERNDRLAVRLGKKDGEPESKEFVVYPTRHALAQMLGTMRRGRHTSLLADGEIPAELAAEVAGHLHVNRLREVQESTDPKERLREARAILKTDTLHGDSGILRGWMGEKFALISDAKIANHLSPKFANLGMRPGSPTFNWGEGMPPSDSVAMSRSDTKSFAFYITDEKLPGSDPQGGLRLGVYYYNSEVGGSSVGMGYVLFSDICCNYLLWNVGEIVEVRRRHVGSTVWEWFETQADSILRADRFQTFARETMAQVDRAMRVDFIDADAASAADSAGDDAKGWTDVVAAFNRFGVGTETAKQAWTARLLTENEDDSHRNSVWRVANGLTSVAKTVASADESATLSRSAAKILATASA